MSGERVDDRGDEVDDVEAWSPGRSGSPSAQGRAYTLALTCDAPRPTRLTTIHPHGTDGFLPVAAERSGRQARLINKRLAEGHLGGQFRPSRLDNLSFCWLRLRTFDPSASYGYTRSRRFGPSGDAETTMHDTTRFTRRQADRHGIDAVGGGGAA